MYVSDGCVSDAGCNATTERVSDVEIAEIIAEAPPALAAQVLPAGC